MKPTKEQIIRAVASSTAIETGQSIEEIEEYLMSAKKTFKEEWVGRVFRCKDTGVTITIGENVRERDFISFGNCFVDVGRHGYYARFGGNIEELKTIEYFGQRVSLDKYKEEFMKNLKILPRDFLEEIEMCVWTEQQERIGIPYDFTESISNK